MPREGRGHPRWSKADASKGTAAPHDGKVTLSSRADWWLKRTGGIVAEWFEALLTAKENSRKARDTSMIDVKRVMPERREVFYTHDGQGNLPNGHQRVCGYLVAHDEKGSQARNRGHLR